MPFFSYSKTSSTVASQSKNAEYFFFSVVVNRRMIVVAFGRGLVNVASDAYLETIGDQVKGTAENDSDSIKFVRFSFSSRAAAEGRVLLPRFRRSSDRTTLILSSTRDEIASPSTRVLRQVVSELRS